VALTEQQSLPRIPGGLLRRPKLEERLNEWAPITVVRGLPGYGKTTRLATWIEDQSPHEVRPVWMTACSTSDEPGTFERSLSQSLRHLDGGSEPVWAGSGSGFVELGEVLLAERQDRKFVLVVDSFQHVSDERILTELVGLVERHRQFHLYVCCRGRHPIESVASGVVEVNAIEPRELLLSADEIVDLAGAMGMCIDQDEAQNLRQSVRGWMATIRMALSETGDSGLRPGTADEYLRIHVLPAVDDQTLLAHLMRFSLAPFLTWPMFRHLCNDRRPGRLLEMLEATGFVDRVQEFGEVRFMIPTAVADMLRRHYTSTEPDNARDFHRRLAEWFTEYDDERHLPNAFHHAVAAEYWELMDRVWYENGTTMIRQDSDLLSRTLDILPPYVLDSRPSMQVYREILTAAAADTDADYRRATTCAFADTCERFVRQHWDTMSANELLIVATGYLIQLRLLGRFQDSAAFGDRVNARVSTLAATDRVVPGRLAWFHLQRGITYSLLHDDLSAVRCYGRAWELATGSPFDFVLSHAAANLALTYAVAGDTERARQWLERHRGIDIDDWPEARLIGIGGHVAAGLMALDRLDDTEVRSALEHVGDGSAPLELWPFIAYLCAQHALHGDRVLEALVQLDRIHAGHDENVTNKGAAVALMTRARADLLIACGRGEKAKPVFDVQGTPLTRSTPDRGCSEMFAAGPTMRPSSVSSVGHTDDPEGSF
jgi:LuxR family transcriptional regulator, maltose regulon positive regulatory protein